MDNQLRNTNDQISKLPDEILLNILSFLPTKDVIATSVLSKRWRFLWKDMKTYMFDFHTLDNIIYYVRVGNKAESDFLEFYSERSNVENLHLQLSPYIENEDIISLLSKEVIRSLRNLKITMVYRFFKLPENLYISSTLETLTLEKLELVDVSSNVFLACLKSLHLLSVRFSDDESVQTLLSICPCLENLVVRRTSYTNVNVFTIDVPTLKSLSIDCSFVNSPPTDIHHGFVINAPSLREFSINDNFSNYLWFENMPDLVKASVNVAYDQPDHFLGSLASTRYLSLCSVMSQTLYPSTSISFVSLEHLELCSCSATWWDLLIFILNDALQLRSLKLKLYHQHYVQSETTMEPWDQPILFPECLSSHLEIFEWRQYTNTELEREVAHYILSNASFLKKATFYLDSENKYEMWNELESVPRGSNNCELVLL